jgi:hypothetical protein
MRAHDAVERLLTIAGLRTQNTRAVRAWQANPTAPNRLLAFLEAQ